MMHPRSLARLAGACYLVVAIAGGFAQQARLSVFVQGDPTATFRNLSSHSSLLVASLAADVLAGLFFLATGILLYTLFKSFSPALALAMLALNAVSVAIQMAALLFQLASILLASSPAYASGLGASGAPLASFFLGLQLQGYLVAQAFFGLYLLPLSLLVWRSRLLPRVFTPILALGALGYLAGIAVTWSSATLTSPLATPLGLVGGLAEVAFLLWLLLVGARTPFPAPSAHRPLTPQT